MSPHYKTVVGKLNQIYETLDNIQELPQVQESKDFMNEIGEAMGHIDNAIDVIKDEKKSESDYA